MNRSTLKEKPKNQTISARKLSRLYEADETAWLEEMVELIKKKNFEILDYKHLREYLSDMARRDRREVFSRLRVLLMHVLKWDQQPRKRSRSWKSTIANQKYDLLDMLDSKTLRNHADDVLAVAYKRARKHAAEETGLSIDRFPEECPYTLDELLKEE